jgi:hypothetical protein
MMRLMGLGDEMSTRTGWSSKREATNNKLWKEEGDLAHGNIPACH